MVVYGFWRFVVCGMCGSWVCSDLSVGGAAKLCEAVELSIVGICERRVEFFWFGWEGGLGHWPCMLGQFVVCIEHSDYGVCILVYLSRCGFWGVCEFCEVCGRVLVGRVCVCVAELV